MSPGEFVEDQFLQGNSFGRMELDKNQQQQPLQQPQPRKRSTPQPKKIAPLPIRTNKLEFSEYEQWVIDHEPGTEIQCRQDTKVHSTIDKLARLCFEGYLKPIGRFYQHKTRPIGYDYFVRTKKSASWKSSTTPKSL